MITLSYLKKTFLRAFKSSPSKDYQFFNQVFLMTILISITGVGCFNILVNPYGIFTSPILQGFNQLKPNKKDNDRLFKAADIIHIKPKTVILGSSRVRQGINPNHPALTNSQLVYNLGLNGVNAYEELRYLSHAIANQDDLKLVIVEIDFFMFNKFLKNQPAFDNNRLEKRYFLPKDIFNSSLSWNALLASYETINQSFKSRQKAEDINYGKNGFMPYRKIDKNLTQWRFEYSIDQYLQFHAKYQLSEQYLEDFKELVELCQRKGITLKVFISPAHATQGEVIRMTGYWQLFEDWKRQIVKIIPVWDFSGYNSITTAKINNKINNYTDNSHYTPQIGRLILNRLFSNHEEEVPRDFGILLTPKNVEEHLKKIRSDRELWARQNSEEIKLVEKVIRKYDASLSTKQ